LLIEEGADISIEDAFGKKAVDYVDKNDTTLLDFFNQSSQKNSDTLEIKNINSEENSNTIVEKEITQKTETEYEENFSNAKNMFFFKPLHQTQAIKKDDMDDEIDIDNSWATSQGIVNALENSLGEEVLLIHPDLASVNTPLSTDKAEQEQGLIDYGKAINGFIGSDKGFLLENGFTKPIILILNTSSAKSTSNIGGSHWVCCVILPNVYTFGGKDIKNDTEQVIFIDSLGAYTLPTAFKDVLVYGKSHTFKTEEGTIEKQNIAGFLSEKATVFNSNVCQQKGGSDCGWWAVSNAIDVVKTGNADFLKAFIGKEPTRAIELRKKFPDLAFDNAENEKINKKYFN
jgi:hypothetical protein